MVPAVYRALYAEQGAAFNLDPWLLEAQVTIESAGNPWAYKPEPRYHYLWDVRKKAPFRPLTDLESADEDPPADFVGMAGTAPTQEWWGQQASWGLLQVMGAVARERGFTGPYLTQLVDPALNLATGAGFLASLVQWAEGDIKCALGAYNAGKGGARGSTGVSYATKILNVYEALKPTP